ncbi:MAG: hemerythrin domain-containing protein [Thermoplasmataceae archaeon]
MAEAKTILDREHKEILEELETVSSENTEAGRVFGEILHIFSRHLDTENETIVPLLNFLGDRLCGDISVDLDKLNVSNRKFNSNYDEMIREHESISVLIGKAKKTLKTEPDKHAMDLADELIHHVELEEALLYPAAFAAGDLVESGKIVHNKKAN